MAVAVSDALIEFRNLSKRFPGEDGGELSVVENITLAVYPGQFVALLGPSGSGKSTLLRLVAGLIAPTSGQLLYRGRPLARPNPYAAMVFQTAALFPWLTVLQNVELGLKAKGVPAAERARKAESLIDLIGLAGFEEARPKELSGGMRQRVGFARALAVDPEVLCLDEPFSGLDFLTAENLRSELLDLWVEKRIPIKCVLMVTHGIEEAVYMADRIVVLSRNPAHVLADIPVTLPYPRLRKSQEFTQLVDRIYRTITEADEPAAIAPTRSAAPAGGFTGGEPGRQAGKMAVGVDGKADGDQREKMDETTPRGREKPVFPSGNIHPLPHAPLGMMSGLVELVADRGGKEDLYRLAAELLLEVDELLPVTELLELLELAEVVEGDIILTEAGKRYAEADAGERKAIVGERLRKLPLFGFILHVLRSKHNHTMRREFFEDVLATRFPDEVDAQLDTAIQLGRHAELFTYDADSRELSLPEEDDDETSTGSLNDEDGEYGEDDDTTAGREGDRMDF